MLIVQSVQNTQSHLIYDVLPLKAARWRYAFANVRMVLGPPYTSDVTSVVSLTFAMRFHLIRLSSAPFTSFRFAKFDWVSFADLRVQRLATKQKAEFTEGAWKRRSYFDPFVDQSSWNFETMYATPPTSHRLCPIVYVTFHSKDICHEGSKSSKNRTNVKDFWPSIFWEEMILTFLQQIVNDIYCPPFGKVWLSSVCWSPSAKRGNEAECIFYGFLRIYGGWVKCRSSLKPFVEQSSWHFGTM